MDNIVLCGFMGCGKTTVGRNLARKSGRKFVDMDSYIEEKAGMKVSEIFEKYGENRFRDMEHEACLELADTKGLVIASGGGAFSPSRPCASTTCCPSSARRTCATSRATGT